MSITKNCEANIDVEAFLYELATESAELIAARIPEQYRKDYLGTYAAGLLVNSQFRNEAVYA